MRVFWGFWGIVALAAVAAAVLGVYAESRTTEAQPSARATSTTRVAPKYVAPPTATAPQFPDDPRGQFDALVYRNGWKVGTSRSSVYDTSDPAYGNDHRYPSYAVLRLCTRLSNADLKSPTQILQVEMEATREPDSVDFATAIQAGFPMLCDADANAQMQRYLSGDIEQWFGNGTYVVGTGENQIPPGTYVCSKRDGMIRDGYWERTAVDGEIIDNNFVTSAQQVTVTIAATDGQFTSERMGTWKPA